MKKLAWLTSLVVVGLTCLGIAHWKGLPLLPARQSTFTLLYTGDVEGYIRPVDV